MDYPALVTWIQEHLTDGLVLVVGSGLSAAEGIPGMPELASHLEAQSTSLTGSDVALWGEVATVLKANEGLEAALLKHQPTESLETWIRLETTKLLLPPERAVIEAVVSGQRTLRLTELLSRILKPPGGLPILTPNYDRLIEVACEMSGLHVDTMACGLYAGTFDHKKSMMASCRAIRRAGRVDVLDHQPRAVVLKPHGSFDWYRNGGSAMRCSVDLCRERAIITPGVNKYKAGYNAPFDKHRELANDHIKQAARLLIIGYGFNDDHLQTHLVQRITEGTPTLVLCRTAGDKVQTLARESPQCVCVSAGSSLGRIAVLSKSVNAEHEAPEIWDVGTLAKELLQ